MSIYLRKDQRFEGRITDKETGKRISFYGKTAEEVKEKIAAAKEKISKKSKCDLTVEKIYLKWIEAISTKFKPSTAAVYRGRVIFFRAKNLLRSLAEYSTDLCGYWKNKVCRQFIFTHSGIYLPQTALSWDLMLSL